MNIKQSKTIKSPEQYVTVEIHNKNLKHKYRLHRSSVLNELKITENILNQNLNRGHIPESNFARFQKNSSSKQSLKLNKKSLLKKKKLITEMDFKSSDNSPVYKMSPEITNKIQQIISINNHLKKVCEPKRKSLQDCVSSVDQKYSLPVVDSPVIHRSLADSPERLKMNKRWKQKIKVSKNYTEHKKKNPLLATLIKKTKATSQISIKEENYTMTPSEIRDKFHNPLSQERKSALIKREHIQFFKQFCSHKPQQDSIYDRKVQLEPIVKIQQFSSGGLAIPFKDYSPHISVKQFAKTRERITFLERVCNHIKEKYCEEFKEMTNEHFQEPNLLSMVYYQENSLNMTEQEKKKFRKKLQFVE